MQVKQRNNSTTWIAVITTAISLAGLSFTIFESVQGLGLPLIFGLITSLLVNVLYVYLKKREKSVFIVYNHDDVDSVQLLIEHLRERNINVFLDSEFIKPGDNIMDRIEVTMQKAKSVIVIYSKEASSSKWMSKEISKAKQLGKEVLPVIVSDDFEVPAEMRDIMYADIRKFDKAQIDKLVASLN